MSTHTLNAWVGHSLLGTLTYDDATSQFAFEYQPSWVAEPTAFPISPALPFVRAAGVTGELHSVSVRRFFENILPEGKALEDAAGVNKVSKANLYGLLCSLGRESTGALSLLPEEFTPEEIPKSKREVTLSELSQRIRDRANQPFTIWDERVRLSIAGLQDKLAIFKDEEEKLYLVDGELASTHILKPEPLNPNLRHLVANEHFCLNLAGRLGLQTPETEIRRVPEAVLVIKRFDRQPDNEAVRRLHCIDTCQALDLGVSHKYERNFGSSRDVAHIRDGVSLERLFATAPLTQAEAATRMGLLRWSLIQYLIGNSDAHGKNISFLVEPGGLRLAPFYDMVSVCIYANIEHEAAMAIGDEFNFDQVRAYDWADFAQRCGIARSLLVREIKRITKALRKELPRLIKWPGYSDAEHEVLEEITALCLKQADQLEQHAKLISGVSIEE
ncbi:MAG: HipA domain-containing protein [Sedimenticola sp.]